MKNRTCLILTYIGKLPNYFDLWWESALNNPRFDFLILMDEHSSYRSIANIIVLYYDLEMLKAKVQKIYDFEIKLNKPYKLCDYRPAYGEIFKEELVGYEFWGHCDPDIIWGNLSNFITDGILNRYDKVYTHGHLSLYRNTKLMNEYYRRKHHYHDCFSYRHAFSSDFCFAYDEWGTKYGGGISEIINRNGDITVYDYTDYADVLPSHYEFYLPGYNNCQVGCFKYENGYVWGMVAGQWKEYAYIHLQKRKMKVRVHNTKVYCVMPNEFVDNITITSGTDRERYYFYKKYLIEKIKSKYQKISQGALKQLVRKIARKINED